MTKQTSYIVKIVGLLWQGGKATYSKTLNHNPTELKSHFGDFKQILDFQVTETTIVREEVGKKTTTLEVKEVITDWQYPKSEDDWVTGL